MTEDQANLTRCCGPEGCGGNSANEAERYCLASRCMGWRWLPRTFEMRAGPVDTVTACQKPEPPANPHQYWQAENVMQETWGLFEDIGFCGLAGKP